VIMFDRHLDRFFRDVLRFMKDRKGIGLAAPQVGVLKRIIVADIGGGPLKLVNPEIVGQHGPETMLEGCLSLPGVFVEIPRSTCIDVAAQGVRGHRVEFEATSLLARVLQHEIEHLSGKLICDYERADHPEVGAHRSLKELTEDIEARPE
jgi:peptide deformylase